MPDNSPVIPTPAEAKASFTSANQAERDWVAAVDAYAPKLRGAPSGVRGEPRWWVGLDGGLVIMGTLPAEDVTAATDALALAADLGIEVVRAILKVHPAPVARGHSGRG